MNQSSEKPEVQKPLDWCSSSWQSNRSVLSARLIKLLRNHSLTVFRNTMGLVNEFQLHKQVLSHQIISRCVREKSMHEAKQFVRGNTQLEQVRFFYQQALIRSLISARNFKKAGALIIEFKHPPQQYPDVLEKLQKSTVAFYLSKFQKVESDQEYLSLAKIEELFGQDKTMLRYLAEFLTERGYYNQAAYFVNFHELAGQMDQITLQNLIRTLSFQIRSSEKLTDEELLDVASGKAQIGSLPINFEPSTQSESDCFKKLPSQITVQFIDEENGLKKMEEEFNKSDILAMDMEWKPIFTKFDTQKVALIQISTRQTCFLIDIVKLGESQELNSLLMKFFEDDTKIKLGFSFSSDMSVVVNSYPKLTCFQNIAKFLDIEKYYRSVMKVQNISLSKACQILLKQKICKRERISNWEVRPLRGAQKHYAALDAYVLLQLYDVLSTTKVCEGSDFESIKRSPQKEAASASIPNQIRSQIHPDRLSQIKQKNISRKEDIFKRKVILEGSLSTMKKHLECKLNQPLELGMVIETIPTKWKKLVQKSEQDKNVTIFTSMQKVFQLVEKCPVFLFKEEGANQNTLGFLHYLDQEQ